ncbi:MAG: hypothetical protein ACK5SE_12760 [Pseudanabaena sp.]
MSEQETNKTNQIQLSFDNVEGFLPSYINAALVNLIEPDTFILDFAFFDPISVRTVQELNSRYPVKPVARIIISRNTAEQLSNSLSLALEQQCGEP